MSGWFSRQGFAAALLAFFVAGGVSSADEGRASPAHRVGTRVADFTLRDIRGNAHRLSQYADRKAIVLAFNAVGCPISKLYAPRLQRIHARYADRGVQVLGLNANVQDDVRELRAFANQYGITHPILKDHDNKVADQLAAERTTAVFLLDASLTVRYQGRLDDQYTITDRSVGIQKSRAEVHYLTDAIDALLAGRKIEVTHTTAVGCIIGRKQAASGKTALTYHENVEPIVQARCQTCHRPGQIAPFSLTTYDDVAGWSGMIREVVTNRRMPPWHADPKHGTFSNDRSLSETELRTLVEWIDAGTPAGDPAKAPPAPIFPDEWQIGEPDVVFEMTEAYDVPATGVVRYQYFSIETDLEEDRWIQAAEVRTDSRDVVHHILVFASDPKAPKRWRRETRGGQRGYFAVMVPGERPMFYPDGMAKKLLAGTTLVFQIHYTPNGIARADRSKIGFVFAKKPVRREVHTYAAYNELALVIPPRAANRRIVARYRFDRDADVLSFLPHMHLRGKAFQYAAHYPAAARVSHEPAWEKLDPAVSKRLEYDAGGGEKGTLMHVGAMSDATRDALLAVYEDEADRKAIARLAREGRSEILLNVPAYDFGWQNSYRLAEPKRMPAGTLIECVAHYNNSASNPALTADMWSKTIRWGDQTWKEMLIGYFDFVYADDTPARDAEAAASD